MKKIILGALLMLGLSAGFVAHDAQAQACSNHGDLDVQYCDENKDLVAEPPKDPQARKTYDHDKEWLSHFPMQFIVTNIRGQDLQYAERRIAALDLVHEKHDQSAIPEMCQIDPALPRRAYRMRLLPTTDSRLPAPRP